MAERQNNTQIIYKMQTIVEILDKMKKDTDVLKRAMLDQQAQIKGDMIMNETMNMLDEINESVLTLKKRAESVANSIEEGANDMIRTQRERSNEISRIRR